MRNEDVVEWSTPNIWDTLREHRNAHGSHIHIRPSEEHRYTARLFWELLAQPIYRYPWSLSNDIRAAYLPISIVGGTHVEPC